MHAHILNMSGTNKSCNTRDDLPSWYRIVWGRTRNYAQCGVQSIFCIDRHLPLRPRESALGRCHCVAVGYQTHGSSPSKVWEKCWQIVKHINTEISDLCVTIFFNSITFSFMVGQVFNLPINMVQHKYEQ